MSIQHIKVIAFDADDTLWINETIFRNAEQAFAKRLSSFLPEDDIVKVLLDTEIRNLQHYGYGIKGFTLSLMEAALRITKNNVDADLVEFILDLGRGMLAEPIELLPGIEDVLDELSKQYKLVVATKGDLLDQERKLVKSGLIDFFHHIEIVSDKKEMQYKKLVKHLDIEPGEFLMVGNSLKSDVIPVLAMGGHAFHIPFHTTWVHEESDEEINHSKFRSFASAQEMLNFMRN
ncbi:MAG: HAD family hydrolase [Cytophagaceae bacterium]|nr:HAD family hydrolase [Cytophagaceae bacterium]